jgi:hypothetical protein
MGHATQVYAVNSVLKVLIKDATGTLPTGLERQMDRLAFRVSENRIVAGVHFPVDLHGGRILGDVIGRYAAERCRYKDGEKPQISVMKDAAPAVDFGMRPDDVMAAWPGQFAAVTVQAPASPPLKSTWDKAVEEFKKSLGKA